MSQATGGETVEGLTLERYAELAVALFDKTSEEREAIARAHGLPPGRLQEVIDGWQARINDPQILLRYNELYQRALVAAGVQRPEVSLEQYAQMMTALGAGAAVAEVCEQNGMTVQQWALVSQHWGERLMADPSIAVEFARLMGYPTGPSV